MKIIISSVKTGSAMRSLDWTDHPPSKPLNQDSVVPGTLGSVGVLVRSDRSLHDRRAGQREVINVVCGPDAAKEILSCNFCETDLRVVLRGIFYVDGVHNNTCVSVVAA